MHPGTQTTRNTKKDRAPFPPRVDEAIGRAVTIARGVLRRRTRALKGFVLDVTDATVDGCRDVPGGDADVSDNDCRALHCAFNSLATNFLECSFGKIQVAHC